MNANAIKSGLENSVWNQHAHKITASMVIVMTLQKNVNAKDRGEERG